MADRTKFVPSHQGDNVLPADPLFTRLLHLAHSSPPSVVIRDINTGGEKTHAQLLSDVLHLRRVISDSLSRTVLQDIREGKHVYINVLAAGGYGFAIAILAILALGAVPSPLSIQYPLNETLYFVRKSRAVAILAGSPNTNYAQAVTREIRTSDNREIIHIPIQCIEKTRTLPLSDILISSDGYCDPNAPGLLIFTSGTTGTPKGVILRKAAISDGSFLQGHAYRLSKQDTILHCLPVHHVTGLWFNFFVFLQAGACIEFKSGSFDPKWTWDRIRRGGLTHLSFVPTIWIRLMRYFREHLTKLSQEEQDSYTDAIKGLKACLSGAAVLPRPIGDWWADILGGRRIIEKYGSSETGIAINTPADDTCAPPEGSAGERSIGVDIKLSEGVEGEILIKSPFMFSGYLGDLDATRAAHTADGYYCTGDLARKEGSYYFIIGRASVDIIKSGGYKISALDIEREILALPYIHEVMVVGVADLEYGQKIGAVVSLRRDKMAQEFFASHGRCSETLTIGELRADLKDNLASYKLPTLLRVIQGELPKSVSGKVVKKTLGPFYFPNNDKENGDVQRWGRLSISTRL